MRHTPAAAGGAGIPRSSGVVVDRERLLRRLDALSPFTAVRGVTGTGKTTLVAGWLRRRRMRGDEVRWVNAADEPAVDALPATIDAVLSAAPRRLVLVVDDAHYLDDAAAVARLSEQVLARDRLHLVVVSRLVHPVERRLRARRTPVTVVTGDDLHATVDELPLLAWAWGHRLDPASSSDLLDRLGGWLAPARIALAGADARRDRRGVLAARRYLREHVLPQIGGDDYLVSAMTLSLAGEVTLPLARALLPDTPPDPGEHLGEKALSQLSDLEELGLLRRSPDPDGGRDTWRFPTLVADVLTETFTSQHRDLARRAHGVIAVELPLDEEQGQTGRVVRHARAAEHWALLSLMWTTHGVRLATAHAEDTGVAYADLPGPVLAEFPSLVLASSVASSLRRDATCVAPADLVRSYADAGWAVPLSSRYRQLGQEPDTMAVASQIIVDRVGGDSRSAVGLAREHRRRILGEGAAPTTGTTRAWFELQSALASFADGDWQGAMNQLAGAATVARAAGVHLVVSAATAHRAMIAAVVGQTRSAENDLAAHYGVDLSRQRLRRVASGPADVAEALLRLDRLDPTAADHLDRAGDGTDSFEEWAVLTWARVRYALLFGDPVVATSTVNHVAMLHECPTRLDGRDRIVLERVRAELFLALGQLNRADRHLGALDPHRLQLAVPRARLALISGDHTLARSIAAVNAWDAHMVRRDRAELLMIKAAAALAMDDRAPAVAAFVTAHRLCRGSGMLLPHASLPRRDLLRLLELSGLVLPAAALDALASCREMYPASGELVTLTLREKVILSAMVEHDTLAEVAGALTVSLNTVKKQAAAIYAKLGVHDRAAALLRAHQLGLLPHHYPVPGGDDLVPPG